MKSAFQQWQRLLRRLKLIATDPEEVPFSRLFRRLLLWYISLLVLLIGLLGLSVGSTVPWMQFVSIENDLAARSTQLSRIWLAAPGSCPFASPGQGYMLACYDSRGHLLGSFGVESGVQQRFLGASVAQAALRDGGTASDALDVTGTLQIHFDFIFFGSGRLGMVRHALVVLKPDGKEVLGVIQLGTTPAETGARRNAIVSIFFVSILLCELLGAPAGGWYLASRAILPARLAFQRQRDFIANVSHELRTPLSLLRANAEVLLRGRTHMSEEDAELLEDIVTEAAYMDKLTDNMLFLASMDADQVRPEAEILNLAQVARGVAQRAQSLAHQKGIALEVQEEEPAHTSGDRALLEQAILIILDNALKYNRSGGEVNIYVFQQNDLACLRVSDTGIGIAPEHLPHLGERFYRVDKARSREAGGNGLGLSIVQGIVSMHQGALTLTSEPGKGTTATLMLPAAR